MGTAALGFYSPELLRRWKAEHEEAIRTNGADLVFGSRIDFRMFIARILAENHAVWCTFSSRTVVINRPDRCDVDDLLTLAIIVPNNARIINAVHRNSYLLSPKETETFSAFELHASALERRQYRRLDIYPKFPRLFEELMQSC